MAQKRVKGKASRGYCNFPHVLMESENFKRLSPYALKLLVDMYSQYRGNNNGDLSCGWKLLKVRGWKSHDTRDAAKAELIHYRMLVQTRDGGLNRCALFAVTWQPIDECIDKETGESKVENYEAPRAALGTWKNERPEWDRAEWERSRPKQPWKGKKQNPTRSPGQPNPLTGSVRREADEFA